MKKILAVCIMAIMAVSMTACGKPAETESEPEVQEEATQEGDAAEETSELSYDKIVVGMDDTFAPMGFRDENGDLTGVDVELAQAVSEQMGIPFELQPIDWSMKETELNNGTIDLIWNGYTITPEREEKVAFTNPYLKNRQVVVTMAESDINTLADLEGKTVAAQAESSAVDAIQAKPEIQDSFKELITLETNDMCLRDMETGRSDAVVADEVLLRYYISKKGPEKYKILDEDFGEEEYGIGARKDDTVLVEAVNNAMVALKESGKTAEISEKWFDSDIIQ